MISVANAMARSFDAEGVFVDFSTKQVFLAGKGAYELDVELTATRMCRRGERAGRGRCAHGPGPISE